MRNAMKELQNFKDRRAAQLAAQNAKIEELDRKIAAAEEAANAAKISGDADAFTAAAKSRRALDNERADALEFRSVLECPTQGTDAKIKELWTSYQREYSKDASAAIKVLLKARKAMYDAYVDVLKIQAAAQADRRQFSACFSEASGVNILTEGRALPLGAVYGSADAKSFLAIFEDELKEDETLDRERLINLIAASRFIR